MKNFFEMSLRAGMLSIALILGTIDQVKGEEKPISTTIKNINWHSSLNSFELDRQAYIGREFAFICNPAPLDFTPSKFSVYGTDRYKVNSSICTSALHAGMINLDGGNVTLRLERGQPFFVGSDRNSVQTLDSGSASIDFFFIGSPLANQESDKKNARQSNEGSSNSNRRRNPVSEGVRKGLERGVEEGIRGVLRGIF